MKSGLFVGSEFPPLFLSHCILLNRPSLQLCRGLSFAPFRRRGRSPRLTARSHSARCIGGRAWQGMAGHGRAWQGMAGHVMSRRDEARHGVACFATNTCMLRAQIDVTCVMRVLARKLTPCLTQTSTCWQRALAASRWTEVLGRSRCRVLCRAPKCPAPRLPGALRGKNETAQRSWRDPMLVSCLVESLSSLLAKL